MHRRALAITGLAAAALAAVITGCGSSGPASWLASGSSEVDYITWTPGSNGQITGTMTVDTASGTAPDQSVSSASYAMTGQISGSSVSLTFQNFLTSATIDGTVSSGTLSLQFPQDSGGIQNATFTTGTTTAFNSAVAQLRQGITAANQAAARQQAQQEHEQADAQAQQAAQADLTTLQDDASFTSDLSQLTSDAQQTGTDLSTEKSDAANGPGDLCDNAIQVTDDSITVDDDAISVTDDLNSLTGDIATARQDIATLDNDLNTLSASSLPPPPAAAAAITAARQAITAAITQANTDIGQVNATDAQAHVIGNNLGTGQCAGDGPGSPPVPVAPVS
jgi:hypothetical protein